MQQQNRFVVLTGHLKNYPLSDLVGILRHQKKTGRLLIEYPKGPATFFFQDGELIDAQLNDLNGLQAVCVAMSLPESAFNFNPLIRATRRSIDNSLQRVVSELLGCWDESALQIESTVTYKEEQPFLATSKTDEAASLPEMREMLALPPAPSMRIPRRYFFIAAAALLVLVSFPIAIAIAMSGRFSKPPAVEAKVNELSTPQPAATLPESSTPKEAATSKRPSRALDQHIQDLRNAQRAELKDQANSSNTRNTQEASRSANEAALQSVNVVMQIENGRIVKASVSNHRPGMDSYEALALRIARQRRYPEKVSGEESVKITVAKSNQ